MRGGVILLLFLPVLASCASSRIVFETAHATATSASAVGKPIIHEMCMEKARECGKAGDATCQPMLDCQKNKDIFVKTTVSVHRAAMMGLLAVAIGDKDGASKWVEKVTGLLQQLDASAKQFGLDKALK